MKKLQNYRLEWEMEAMWLERVHNNIKKYSTWSAGALDALPMVDCLT